MTSRTSRTTAVSLAPGSRAAEKLGTECIQSDRQMLADLLGTFSVGRQRAPDGVDHIVPIGGKHRHAAASLGKLSEDVRTMRCRHGPDHVGLAGEIRPAPRGQERLREAAKLGFTQAIIPKANVPRQAIAGLEIIASDRVEDALARLR